jgi:formamidopyrimidine-DNA glycosylase
LPELPEVEVFRRQVEGQVLGRTVAKVTANRPEPLNLPLDKWRKRTSGAKVVGVERRGKALLFHLDNGQCVFLHLRMGGRVWWQPSKEVAEEGVSVAIHMDGGGALVFDRLQLGQVHLYTEEELASIPFLAEMGPDPLSEEFTQSVFDGLVQGKRKALKALLCDQTLIAGIGNEYSAEILWEAKIHPEAGADQLTKAKRRRLYQAVREVLGRAVAQGATYGKQPFRIVGREGEKCPRCSAKIVKIEFGGRGTYLCPKCQKGQ